MLVENKSAVNVIPMLIVQRLQNSMKDLIHTKVSISSFVGEITKSLGFLPVEWIVGTQIILTAFFIVNSLSSHNTLLGRNWIHINYYVPSYLHQMLIMWYRDKVEIVWVNTKPF